MDAQQKWRCDECDTLHDDHYKAQECCPPQITEVWTCGKCGKEFEVSVHKRKDDELKELAANACCCDEDGNEIVTLADLEGAGQQRLPL